MLEEPDFSTSPRELTPGLPSDYQHVYVHVPFCGRRCSYCDFAIAVRREVPVSEYVDAIMAELVTRELSTPTAPLRSLYLGGGTPSKLGGPGIERLIQTFSQWLNVENFPTSAEVTIEINPEDITPEAVAQWVRSGVNRASVGIQSFDPAVLNWMHREHTPQQVQEGARTLRDGGIGNISVDLIFALPGHLERDLERDLDLALGLESEHLSVYGLTIEPKTPVGRWLARGELAEAPEERYASEFLRVNKTLTAAGFEHYEVSNFARPGARAIHNSAYWSGVPYLGLGPAAHGFDGQTRRWNISAYAAWLAALAGSADPVEGRELLTPDQRSVEAVYLGLRTIGGLELHEGELAEARRFADEGWGTIEDGRLVLSPTGWLRLDSLATRLSSIRSSSRAL